MPNIDAERLLADNSNLETIKICTYANEPISQGLDMIYAVFRFMAERMTQGEYLDFMECVKAILNNGVESE